MGNQQKTLKEQNIEAHSETERWFALPDINFLTMDSSNQEEALDSFAKYISRLPCGYTVKLVFKKEAINAKKEYPLLEEKGDEFDIYRASFNKDITAPLYSQFVSEQKRSRRFKTLTVQQIILSTRFSISKSKQRLFLQRKFQKPSRKYESVLAKERLTAITGTAATRMFFVRFFPRQKS